MACLEVWSAIRPAWIPLWWASRFARIESGLRDFFPEGAGLGIAPGTSLAPGTRCGSPTSVTPVTELSAAWRAADQPRSAVEIHSLLLFSAGVVGSVSHSDTIPRSIGVVSVPSGSAGRTGVADGIGCLESRCCAGSDSSGCPISSDPRAGVCQASNRTLRRFRLRRCHHRSSNRAEGSDCEDEEACPEKRLNSVVHLRN